MKKVLFVFAILIVSISLLKAQSVAVGPQLGFSKTKDADKTAIMPAAAIRLDLIGLGVEGSIGYKSEKFDDGNVKTTSYPVLLTGMLNVFPFIHAEAGIGWYNTKIEYSALLKLQGAKDETTQEIGYHLGAGAEIPLGNVILTGDFRYVFLNTDFSKVSSSIESLKSDYYTLSIGLLFKL